jgi:hypothetical protein
MLLYLLLLPLLLLPASSAFYFQLLCLFSHFPTLSIQHFRCHGRPLRPPFLPSNPKNGVVNHRLHHHSTPMQRRFMQPQKKNSLTQQAYLLHTQDCRGFNSGSYGSCFPAPGNLMALVLLAFLNLSANIFPRQAAGVSPVA